VDGIVLIGLLTWWLRQLAELLPARWRGLGDGGAATVVSLLAGGAGTSVPEVEIGIVGRRGVGTLCRVALDEAGVAEARAVLAGRRRPAQVVLRMPAAALLEREVMLPLAAERDPDAVLGYEMDRLTPFRAADVAWRASGLKRDRVRNRLSLRLSLVPRALFAEALPALARIGLRPVAVEGATHEGLQRIALGARGGTQGGWGRIDRRRARLVGALVALLAVVAVGIPFVRQSLAERAVAAQIAALRPRVEEVAALRRRIGRGGGEGGALAALAARVGNPLAVLAALTEILPDDTYLESLALSQRKLSITGRSAAAARLIGLLAANRLIANPAFAAPVTRAPQGGDEFTIRADVGP
jgi:general secretion pathway protein L